jgi:uncharacterized membrane protein YpjA
MHNMWNLFWSEHFFFSKPMLWLLLVTNGAGTIYGYLWYGNQLKVTYDTMDAWLLPFVPDSPTASLFFTLSLVFIMIDRSSRSDVLRSRLYTIVRAFVHAFAIVTSIKYGIWAVAMIAASGLQGDVIVWKEWMLVVSHLGMAIEVVLFSRLLRFGWISTAIAGVWVLFNDYLDYHHMIYPWLPDILEDDLKLIEIFTVFLSYISLLTVFVMYKQRLKQIKL